MSESERIPITAGFVGHLDVFTTEEQRLEIYSSLFLLNLVLAIVMFFAFNLDTEKKNASVSYSL